MAELRVILISISILIAFFVGSYVVNFILFLIKKLVSKTKTKLDDEIIRSLYKPIRFLSIILGVFFAVYYIERDLKIDGISVTSILVNLIILWIAYTISRLISTTLKWYAKEIAPKTQSKVDDHLFPFVRKVITIIIFVIALVIILDRFGIQIGPLIAGLGVAGLAVALALQDTLSNFFAGVHILGDKPIRVGDFIKLESGQEGYVREIGWRSIRIETPDNNNLILPNSKLAQSIITNFSIIKETNITIDVNVSYDSDVNLVEKILIDSIKTVSKKNKIITKEFEPLVRLSAFGDNALNFKVVYQIDDYTQNAQVSSDIRKEILMQFKKHKIEIPYQIRTIIQKK